MSFRCRFHVAKVDGLLFMGSQVVYTDFIGNGFMRRVLEHGDTGYHGEHGVLKIKHSPCPPWYPVSPGFL